MHTRKNTTSRDICNSSSNFLKSITKSTIFLNYNKHIIDITNKFTTSHNILLNDIIYTKNTNKFTLTFTETLLDKYNNVPPFIEIFRYLITKSDFINKFSSEEQKILYNNLSTNHTIQECYKFIEKSNLDKKILDIFYSITHSSTHSIKSELIEKFPSIEFHNLLINSFTSFNIIEDLELRIKKLVTFNVEWQGKKIDNLVYLFMYENMLTEFNYQELGNEIIKRILFFNAFLHLDKLPSKFIIFLTDKKKVIDDNVILHMHFKTINVNTAVTNGRDIIIYREQELLKSIFHELIHFHNLDFRQIPDNIIQYIIKTHNIKTDNEYLLYECVTEAMANILNNLFLSSSIKKFTFNLQNEILFSTLQVIKILNVCGYNTWDEFSNLDIIDMYSNKLNNNPKQHFTNPKKQFKQDSCIMSYYILKFYILINLDTYFKTCLDTKIKFIQTSESFNNLIHIFDLSRKNIFIKTIIDNVLMNISTNAKNSKSIKHIKHIKNKLTNKINKTLRMTCIESILFSKNSI